MTTGRAVLLFCGILSSLLYVAGDVYRGARFRFYSIATIVTVFVFGLLTYIGGIRLAAGQATPWLGVHERIMLYAFLLWNAVLAIALLRDPGKPLRRNVPA